MKVVTGSRAISGVEDSVCKASKGPRPRPGMSVHSHANRAVILERSEKEWMSIARPWAVQFSGQPVYISVCQEEM